MKTPNTLYVVMREIWLQTNRRILWLGMIVPCLFILFGLLLVWQSSSWPLGLAIAAVGLSLVTLLAWQMTVPRLAYRTGELLIFLRSGPPLRLPIEFAECFFVSSGAGQLSTPQGDLPIRNLVMRVAERAIDYQERAVKSTFGKWADGYVTFYGTWCEPLNLELVQKLNAKLSSARPVP